ncbi:hypothetical protein IE53DRAFT_371684 [Violaceomyces palustris]|uniref:Uncharacterized protein n=1 Tax=Violaceomyces palustris TaxID=1673888 RepID=A0ACD0NMU6_9BASI|nr:hypothetical protein IE53DRAFT_371684 [Violaceomyces palustris]
MASMQQVVSSPSANAHLPSWVTNSHLLHDSSPSSSSSHALGNSDANSMDFDLDSNHVTSSQQISSEPLSGEDPKDGDSPSKATTSSPATSATPASSRKLTLADIIIPPGFELAKNLGDKDVEMPSSEAVAKAAEVLNSLRGRMPEAGDGQVAACDYCRRRKIKCDRVKPSCGSCNQAGRKCTTEDMLRKRGPPSKKERAVLEAAGIIFRGTRPHRKRRPTAASASGHESAKPNGNKVSTTKANGGPKSTRHRSDSHLDSISVASGSQAGNDHSGVQSNEAAARARSTWMTMLSIATDSPKPFQNFPAPSAPGSPQADDDMALDAGACDYFPEDIGEDGATWDNVWSTFGNLGKPQKPSAAPDQIYHLQRSHQQNHPNHDGLALSPGRRNKALLEARVHLPSVDAAALDWLHGEPSSLDIQNANYANTGIQHTHHQQNLSVLDPPFGVGDAKAKHDQFPWSSSAPITSFDSNPKGAQESIFSGNEKFSSGDGQAGDMLANDFSVQPSLAHDSGGDQIAGSDSSTSLAIIDQEGVLLYRDSRSYYCSVADMFRRRSDRAIFAGGNVSVPINTRSAALHPSDADAFWPQTVQMESEYDFLRAKANRILAHEAVPLLLGQYFDWHHNVHPFFQQSKVRIHLACLRDEQQGHGWSPMQVRQRQALLLALCAMASCTSEGLPLHHLGGVNGHARLWEFGLGCFLLSRALIAPRAALPENDECTLEFVQTLAIMAIYLANEPSRDNSWKAIKAAWWAGCKLGGQHTKDAKSSSEETLSQDEVDSEMLKRAMWMVYQMEKMARLVRRNQIDWAFIDDSEVTMDFPNLLPGANSANDPPGMYTSEESLAAFISEIKINVIMSRILKSPLCSPLPEEPPPGNLTGRLPGPSGTAVAFEQKLRLLWAAELRGQLDTWAASAECYKQHAARPRLANGLLDTTWFFNTRKSRANHQICLTLIRAGLGKGAIKDYEELCENYGTPSTTAILSAVAAAGDGVSGASCQESATLGDGSPLSFDGSVNVNTGLNGTLLHNGQLNVFEANATHGSGPVRLGKDLTLPTMEDGGLTDKVSAWLKTTPPEPLRAVNLLSERL